MKKHGVLKCLLITAWSTTARDTYLHFRSLASGCECMSTHIEWKVRHLCWSTNSSLFLVIHLLEITYVLQKASFNLEKRENVHICTKHGNIWQIRHFWNNQDTKNSPWWLYKFNWGFERSVCFSFCSSVSFYFLFFSSAHVLLWLFIIWSWRTLHLSSVLCAFLCLPHVQFLTKGCETSEMTLRRNGLGQLGFHVNYEGIVAEVPLCIKLRCSSKTVWINMFYNSSKFTLLALEELLTHK